MTVNKILSGHFSDIFNVKFTSDMEEELDKIESGDKRFIECIVDDPKAGRAIRVRSERRWA